MTSPSPLERLTTPGNVLAKEPPDAKEFDGLVRSGLAPAERRVTVAVDCTEPLTEEHVKSRLWSPGRLRKFEAN